MRQDRLDYLDHLSRQSRVNRPTLGTCYTISIQSYLTKITWKKPSLSPLFIAWYSSFRYKIHSYEKCPKWRHMWFFPLFFMARAGEKDPWNVRNTTFASGIKSIKSIKIRCSHKLDHFSRSVHPNINPSMQKASLGFVLLIAWHAVSCYASFCVLKNVLKTLFIQ